MSEQITTLDYWRELIECESIGRLMIDAENWNTCAIGERDRQLRCLITDPDDPEDDPEQDIQHILSEKAFRLGCEFLHVIEFGNQERALQIISEIESMTEQEFYKNGN